MACGSDEDCSGGASGVDLTVPLSLSQRNGIRGRPMRLVVTVASVIVGCSGQPSSGVCSNSNAGSGVVSCPSGGATSSGGAVGTGGASGTGGAVTTGGAVGTSGAVGTGGAVSTGGASSTGGYSATGGTTPGGGASGTAGGATGASCVPGDGSWTKPLCIDSLPFVVTENTATSGVNVIDVYTSCAPGINESGPEVVYEIIVPQRETLLVSVSDDALTDVDVHLLTAASPDACIARGNSSLTRTIEPGTYLIAVDTFGTSAGPFTLTVTTASNP